MPQRLVVFIGKPGAGKLRLLGLCFQIKKIDVLPYVYAYKVNGRVPEDKTMNGYRDMYRDLSARREPLIILELGSNHPEFNVQQLVELQKKFNITVFVCTADVDTLRRRIIGRNRGDDMEAMERRLQWNTPDIYISLFKKNEIAYQVINTEKGIEKSMQLIEQLIKFL